MTLHDPGSKLSQKLPKMGDKVGENPAALRAAVFLLSAKNRKGGVQTPPAGRRLKKLMESSSNLFLKCSAIFGLR